VTVEIRITPYGLDAWQRALRDAPEMAQREMLRAAEEATLALEVDVKTLGHYPRKTGLTQDGISRQVSFSEPAGVLGVVGSASPVAAFLEFGTRRMTARPSFPAVWARQRAVVQRFFEDAAGRIAKNMSDLPGGAA
jgi:hypothetical protein